MQTQGLGTSYLILGKAGASSAVVPISVGSSRISWTYRRDLAGRWVSPKIGRGSDSSVVPWGLLRVDASEQEHDQRGSDMMVAGRSLGTSARDTVLGIVRFRGLEALWHKRNVTLRCVHCAVMKYSLASGRQREEGTSAGLDCGFPAASKVWMGQVSKMGRWDGLARIASCKLRPADGGAICLYACTSASHRPGTQQAVREGGMSGVGTGWR